MKTCLPIRPIASSPAIIRTDSAPGFKSLVGDKSLLEHNITVEVGNPKNANSNPVAEKAVQDVEKELLRVDPTGAQVSSTTLAVACCTLNSRVGALGLSPREVLFHRDQFTNERIDFEDMDLITKRQRMRDVNHSHSERSKAPNRQRRPRSGVVVGDIVYLHQDLTKNSGRERYLVSARENDWVFVRKFAGTQLRANTYKVREEECFRVPGDCRHVGSKQQQPNDSEEDDCISSQPITPPTLSSADTDLAGQHQTSIPSETPNRVPNHTDCANPIGAVAQEPSRPSRNKMRPTHLEDYYTDF